MFKQLPTMISELNKLGIALKALDGMNLATVGVNTGNLGAFRSAIKGLSTEQAVFALASKGATEEQIRQILITKQSETADVEAALAKAGLTTATSALTQAEMVELATKTGVAKADAEALLSKIGITAAEEGQVAVKHQVTMAMLEQAVANGTLTSAESAQIATMLGLNAAETANIGITNILTGAVAKLWAVITAHPIGAILTAIGAVAVGVIAYINKSNKDAQKAIVEAHEKAQQALDDTKIALSDDKSELESVNSELDSTKKKIQDIALQGAITLTEQNELDKLSTANTQLETQKSLLENNIKLKQKSVALDAKNLLGTQVEMNYSDIQDGKDIVSRKESYTYAEHAEYEASSLKNAYNIYMSALKTGNAEKQKLAQELIDKAGGDTAELTSSLLEIVESFKYDDGTIIDGYKDLYDQYMGLIYNLQSLTNPDMFLDIAKQATQGTNIDYEKAISDGYAMAYDGEFDIDKLNQDFVKALADNGIDESTIKYIFKLKQQEYQSVVDKIDSKYKVATEIPDTVMVKQDTWNTDGSMTSEYVEIDVDEETKKHIMEVNKINQTLNDYAKENPIEFELLTSYDENFTELDKIIEEERLKADNAIQDTKSQLEDLSKNGNVDLTIRPVIDSSAMQAAGWDVEDGSIATTFTQGEFIWQGDEENGQYVYVHYTPILPDGTVLTPDQLSDYLHGTLEGSQNILDADDKGIVLKVDTDLQGILEDDIKALQEDGKLSIKMSNFLSQMGQWDDSLHDVQEDYYLTGNSVDYVTKAVDKLISKIKDKAFDTSEHSLSDIFELKTDDNTLTSLGKISEEIDNIQTAAKGLKEAMDTYNETGVISIDQLQSILSYGDEYLKYITDENGNLVLNEQAIKNVTQARLEELRAKTLENLLSNLENIDNEATAQAYLKSQVLETAQSYEDLAVAEIQAWQAEMLAKSKKGETDLTVATINEVTEGYIRQANAINNLFNNTNLASVFETSTSASKDTETALDRITKKYKELTDIIGSNLNLIKSQISLLETRGSTVGRGYYDELISQSTEKINILTEQYNELRKQFLQTDKGTEEWLELNAAILETQNAIIGAKADIEGFQNSIDKLHWDELDKIADAIGNISDEAKSVVDLLNTDDVLDDNGNFTKDAITALAMYGEQLESAQYLINKYSKEIEYLNGEYTKGTITVEEYNEKMQDLNDKQWKSVDAYNAAKKAIIELRKKGIDEEIDALEELYDARKKAWEQEKDQHDWEKTVSENETNINKLKAQIAELQNDNSLAGIKKRKELEDELKDLESDWEDTLYDHVYDERQDQLDKELDDKKKALEKTLDDEEKLVADSIDLVNKNSTTILDNLNRLSRGYGIQMSNSLTEPFTHGENALSHYSTMFSEANSAFTDQLNYTAMGIYQLQLDADNAAVSVVNMFNSANGTLLEQLSLVRQSLQEITNKANEAANAVRNAGVATPTNTTTTVSNSTSSTNRSLGDMAHDTSGTTLPNAGTWKNVQNNIEKAKKDLETIEKQKKVGLVKNTPNKFTTISKGYASGTQSATKGLHPIYEDGVEIIEKDGCLIYPIGAFDGGEKVFNNEQTQRLWELSQNPDVMEKFRQELLNIKPCIDFKFGNTAPVTKTNQNVNVQQHFDALVKVEGDMTPSVYDQLVNDKRIERLMKDWSMEEAVDSINTRGYKIGRIR